MKYLDLMLIRQIHAQYCLRIALAAIFLSHGITRAYMGRVEPFGTSFDSWGFPFGIAWAWGVTLFEITGSLLLLANRQVRLVCLLLILEMIFGIILVHFPYGWFVVGHGHNGMEYSFLIIASLLALFALNQSRQ